MVKIYVQDSQRLILYMFNYAEFFLQKKQAIIDYSQIIEILTSGQ